MTSRDDLGGEALRRLVDEEQLVVIEQRPSDRDHLLLPAREGSGHLRAALHEVGEQLIDELAPRVALPFGESEILRDRELREHLAVLRHVSHTPLHDAMSGEPVDPLAGESDLPAAVDETEDAAERRGLADAVAAQHRRDSGRRNRECDVLHDLLAGDRAAQAAHLEDGAAHAAAVPR